MPEYPTSPFPAYVSLRSALCLHGRVWQVPAITNVISLARTRRFTTPLGTVSVHQVRPTFFVGYDDAGPSGGRLATPEKSLVDFVYLTPAQSGLLRPLPELEWPKRLRVGAARVMVGRIEPVRRRTLVAWELERLLETRRARLACVSAFRRRLAGTRRCR